MDENGGHYIHHQHHEVSNADPSRIVAHASQIVACAAVSQFTLRGRRRGTRTPHFASASAIFWFETLSSGA